MNGDSRLQNYVLASISLNFGIRVFFLTTMILHFGIALWKLFLWDFTQRLVIGRVFSARFHGVLVSSQCQSWLPLLVLFHFQFIDSSVCLINIFFFFFFPV